MKVIQEGKERIVKTWGEQKLTDADYRLLKYLFRVNVKDGEQCDTDDYDTVLLHNVVTGELIALDRTEAGVLDSLPCKASDATEELIKKRFLVPVGYDEKKAVYQLRKVLNVFQRPKYITGYTILPTTNCNARCFYCYEANYKHINMTPEVADKTVEFIADHHGDRDVHIGWFGGEPLLGWQRIDQICQGLQDREIRYSSSMTTNGYLFDEEMVKKAKDFWKLKSLQITLDGTEQVYNEVKAYVNNDLSPYQRVISNIGLLADNEIRVSIRMNLDRHNADNLKELISELAERFGGNKYVSGYVDVIFDDCGFAPVTHSDDDHHFLLSKANSLNDLLVNNGLYSINKQNLPCLKLHYCMADSDSSIVITPNGDLVKCEHIENIGAIGNIYCDIVDYKKLNAWKNIVDHSECFDCPLLPNCFVLSSCIAAPKCHIEERQWQIKAAKKLMINIHNNQI